MAEAIFSLDLHVLSIPPAFALSQDQTLQFDFLKLLLSLLRPLICYLIFKELDACEYEFFKSSSFKKAKKFQRLFQRDI